MPEGIAMGKSHNVLLAHLLLHFKGLTLYVPESISIFYNISNNLSSLVVNNVSQTRRQCIGEAGSFEINIIKNPSALFGPLPSQLLL
jgi:hypothetical protein